MAGDSEFPRNLDPDFLAITLLFLANSVGSLADGVPDMRGSLNGGGRERSGGR